MATVRPARNYWDALATDWCYFDAVTGTTIVHNSSMLVIATDNTNPAAATFYSAVKFDTVTGPSWTTVGPIAANARGFIYSVGQAAARAGGFPGTIQIAQINDPWDDSYTAAQMRALSLSSWTTSFQSVLGVGEPRQLYYATGTNSAYGVMLRVLPGDATKGGSLRMFTNPIPIMRHFYQYSPTDAVRGDATTRATLSTEALAVLASESMPKYFDVSTTVLTSDILPAQSDTEIIRRAGTDGGGKTREMNWPESWQLDIPAAGGMGVSLVSNTLSSTLRGMPVESELAVVLKDGTSETIGKQFQIVGDIIHKNDGTGEIELRSPIEAILNSTVINYSPYMTGTVNYDAELAPYIIVDAIMNSGRMKYEHIHYNDLAYLLKRFSGVFSTLTYTAADLADMTVGDLIAEIGPIYALCICQAASGCIGFFHPAVYRPSLKVWTIDEDDCRPGGYALIERGYDGQYGSIYITSTPTDYDTLYYPYDRIPSEPGIHENRFSLVAQGSVFDTAPDNPNIPRQALARQLSQRLCNRRIECELQLSLAGLAIECGDVIKLTGAGLSDTTRFLVFSVQGLEVTGEVTVKGVHYPEVLSLANTFEATGIEGCWRWLDETGTQTTENQAPDGTDDDPTTCTLATGSTANEHWQGIIHETGYADWSVPLVSATKHDVIDVCTIIRPEVEQDVANITPWADDTYMPIFAWFNSSNRECIAVGFYRPGYAATDDIVTDTLFVAHINDIAAVSFTFATAVAYSPNGICGRDDGYGGNTPASIALQWDDSGNVNLYVDRQLACSGSGFSKAGWDSFRVMTQYDIFIGCVRHLQTDTAITELQRLQGLNGLDTYEP